MHRHLIEPYIMHVLPRKFIICHWILCQVAYTIIHDSNFITSSECLNNTESAPLSPSRDTAECLDSTYISLYQNTFRLRNFLHSPQLHRFRQTRQLKSHMSKHHRLYFESCPTKERRQKAKSWHWNIKFCHSERVKQYSWWPRSYEYDIQDVEDKKQIYHCWR